MNNSIIDQQEQYRDPLVQKAFNDGFLKALKQSLHMQKDEIERIIKQWEE